MVFLREFEKSALRLTAFPGGSRLFVFTASCKTFRTTENTENTEVAQKPFRAIQLHLPQGGLTLWTCRSERSLLQAVSLCSLCPLWFKKYHSFSATQARFRARVHPGRLLKNPTAPTTEACNQASNLCASPVSPCPLCHAFLREERCACETA